MQPGFPPKSIPGSGGPSLPSPPLPAVLQPEGGQEGEGQGWMSHCGQLRAGCVPWCLLPKVEGSGSWQHLCVQLSLGLACMAGGAYTSTWTPWCAAWGRGEASRVATELGSGHQGTRAGPWRDVQRVVTSWNKPSFPVGSGGVYGILYRPHTPTVQTPRPYLPSWWRPVPAVGGEFCRLYRNRPPIFLQLSDFVNWDYTDRRKVF